MATPVINQYTASSLGEFFDKISLIKQSCCIQNDSPVFSPLWFRGHEYNYYTLLPSIFRQGDVQPNVNKTYSAVHLGEDYRYQNFKSRAFHQIDSCPESRIEWQEIMQHHFTWTRLMDWSESAVSSLLFALEAFITPLDDLTNQHRRTHATPVVWVICPYRLNKTVYRTFAPKSSSSFSLIKAALYDIIHEDHVKRKKVAELIGNELKNNINQYFSSYDKNGGNDKAIIDGIIGLSVIDSYRKNNSSRLYEMLSRYEFNPFFYLLTRYYVDGIGTPVTSIGQLPPLAMIHPYHSNRIKAQRGAFTIFPYYCSAGEGLSISDYSAMGTDLRAMEHQLSIRNCLFKIRICNADKVARELLQIGEKRSSIYPELERYANDIEADKYHI